MMLFKTKIFHPLVNSKGAIKIEIIRNNWGPALTISKVLMTIVSLLDDPVAMSYKDVKFPKFYSDDRANFHRIARDWTINYI